MVCMVVGAIINTILDPIFIFVCDWGIAGAAWATVIGQKMCIRDRARSVLLVGRIEGEPDLRAVVQIKNNLAAFGPVSYTHLDVYKRQTFQEWHSSTRWIFLVLISTML